MFFGHICIMLLHDSRVRVHRHRLTHLDLVRLLFSKTHILLLVKVINCVACVRLLGLINILCLLKGCLNALKLIVSLAKNCYWN
jgi:hypothetical protein